MLYRKYRPTRFSDVAGQKHVVRTLQGAIEGDKVGHAYLFSGTRGTGKTTMARLLAKTLNCTNIKNGPEPCNACDSCKAINLGNSLDLIEIDAASNRGIDEIRNIKESAQVASTSSKNKVFIIDEVHMLTTPAFNALLKTLEEPPSHVVFILATTEPHKVLDTIMSRVQRFDFRNLSHQDIVTKLTRVAKEENVGIEKEALASLASFASGSLRDAESAMAKVFSYTSDSVTGQHVSEILGIVPSSVHENILLSLEQKDSRSAIGHIADLYESGINLDDFSKQFLHFARARLVSSVSDSGNPTIKHDPKFLVPIISAFVDARAELKHSPIPTLPLELAVIKLCSTD